MKYSDALSDLLVSRGYSHCFFVAGGNSMHLLDSARKRFVCIPFVHEVSAAIAAEYFNQLSDSEKSFVLVTAGPGLTNTATAIAGSFLESRELLVIGGQVKSTDLATGNLRQRGIQEIDGVGIVSSITKLAIRIEEPLPLSRVSKMIDLGMSERPGPVFLEICLDVQGVQGDWSLDSQTDSFPVTRLHGDGQLSPQPGSYMPTIKGLVHESKRPVFLVGGGLTYENVRLLNEFLELVRIPVMTTWNAADRIGAEHPRYFGRPNTWGQRYSNVLIQQSDLVIAVGTRLGLQQTGFNWEHFAPLAKIIHVDIDENELEKGHPSTAVRIKEDAASFIHNMFELEPIERPEWVQFCRRVQELLPLSEPTNSNSPSFVNPYDFVLRLSEILRWNDIVIPCSSGGAFTTMMQAFNQKAGQRIVTNKGLASMGYGLAGAIGASFAHKDRRVILVEGDGGFAQNLQELATVVTNGLNLKAFIFSNEGYASIRMTQLNYFQGEYLGCDTKTGLGFPNWELLAAAFGLDYINLDKSLFDNEGVITALNSPTPTIFVVPIDPFQTYYPKISSSVGIDGSMRSNPLHEMSPELSDEAKKLVLPYLL